LYFLRHEHQKTKRIEVFGMNVTFRQMIGLIFMAYLLHNIIKLCRSISLSGEKERSLLHEICKRSVKAGRPVMCRTVPQSKIFLLYVYVAEDCYGIDHCFGVIFLTGHSNLNSCSLLAAGLLGVTDQQAPAILTN
jgi:hypothetical protein